MNEKLNKIKGIGINALVMASVGLTTIMTSSADGGAIFTKIGAALNTFYGSLMTIITPLAAMMLVIAALIAFLSKDQKKVGEAISWAKRIIVCWFLIAFIGLVVAYIGTDLFGGQGTSLVG